MLPAGRPGKIVAGRQKEELNLEGYRFTHLQKVIWRDLDALGHVNNAVYATYFETARLEYLADVLGEAVNGLILAEITVTYKTPAFLRETLVVQVKVSEIRNSSFVMEGQIHDQESGRLVATSRAVIVHYDYSEKRSVPVPDSWREAIARFEEGR